MSTKRMYILYDDRGSEDGVVFEAVGEFRSVQAAVKDILPTWEDFYVCLCSYQKDGNKLVDERVEFTGMLTKDSGRAA